MTSKGKNKSRKEREDEKNRKEGGKDRVFPKPAEGRQPAVPASPSCWHDKRQEGRML